MTTNPIPITKGENQRLRWLLKAAASPSTNGTRAVLTGASIEHQAIVATDGFRLQAIETPYHVREALQGTVARFDDLKASSETVTTTRLTSFPDYHMIMPKGEPVFEIALDGQLLREALEGMKGGYCGKVRLRFYGPTQPVEVFGQATDESRAYALIMPIRPGHENGKPWRP